MWDESQAGNLQGAHVEFVSTNKVSQNGNESDPQSAHEHLPVHASYDKGHNCTNDFFFWVGQTWGTPREIVFKDLILALSCKSPKHGDDCKLKCDSDLNYYPEYIKTKEIRTSTTYMPKTHRFSGFQLLSRLSPWKANPQTAGETPTDNPVGVRPGRAEVIFTWLRPYLQGQLYIENGGLRRVLMGSRWIKWDMNWI